MGLLSKKVPPSREEQLAARPVRLVDVVAEPVTSEGSAGDAGGAAGGAVLRVPLAPPRWAAWLMKYPTGATKTFELDRYGLEVWEACDGKSTVRQIIQRLATRQQLNLREAEVATLAFLKTLMRKGLVGLAVPRPQK